MVVWELWSIQLSNLLIFFNQARPQNSQRFVKNHATFTFLAWKYDLPDTLMFEMLIARPKIISLISFVKSLTCSIFDIGEAYVFARDFLRKVFNETCRMTNKRPRWIFFVKTLHFVYRICTFCPPVNAINFPTRFFNVYWYTYVYVFITLLILSFVTI